MEIRDIDLLKDAGLLFRNKVIIWGAGRDGKMALRLLTEAEIPVDCVCDKDTDKQGREIFGTQIVSPETVMQKTRTEDTVIIIATDLYGDAVLQHLNEMGICPSGGIYSHFGLNYALEYNIYNPCFAPAYRNMKLMERRLKAAQHSIQEAKNLEHELMMAYWADVRPILVYQVGKVGSMSVYTSLLSRNMPAIHTHQIWDSPAKALLARADHKTTKIITMVREPIGRHLAEYMENMDDGFLDCEAQMDLCQNIIDRFVLYQKTADTEFDWFDQEIRRFTGIDIFDYPFDRVKGYGLIRQGEWEILVLKTEKLSDNEKVIGEFAGIPNFKLKNDNVAGKKPYRYLYANLKHDLKISREIVEYYYTDNERMDHFYTEEEKQVMRRKWEA